MRPYELGFLTGRDAERRDWEHGAALRGIPAYKDPAKDSRPMKVRVLKAFCVGAKRQEVDTVLTLPASDALLIAADGFCVLVEE
jgi:hypothetical protein